VLTTGRTSRELHSTTNFSHHIVDSSIMKLIEVLHGKFLFTAAGSVVLRVSLQGESDVQVLRHEQCADTQVVSMTLSADGNHLFVGHSNKVLACWELASLSCISSATLRKQPTSLQFGTFDSRELNKAAPSQPRDVVLASDKAGEVFALDAPGLKKQALVAGHTASVITDMATHASASAGRTLVATADRDEKVRISHFPDMENISTFCLAHTKVVTSVCFVEFAGKTLLLSTSWDHKLILWDAITGEALQTISFLPTEEGKGAATDAAADASADTTAENAEQRNAAETGEVAPTAEGDGQDAAAAGQGEDGEEDLEGKVYDELSAGSYPFKVVCNQAYTGTPAETVVYIAVLFKNSTTVKLFSLTALTDETKGAVFALGEAASVTLEGTAVDAAFTGAEEVAVVQPMPQGLHVLHVQAGATVVQGRVAVTDVSNQRAYVNDLMTKADELGKTCCTSVTVAIQLLQTIFVPIQPDIVALS
jgi:hypothetical protein